MIGRVLWLHPWTLLGALLLLGVVLGVSCWPRLRPVAVEPTATPTYAIVMTVIPAPAATATPGPDIFTVPPTVPPERLPVVPMPTATVTPTATSTRVPPTPPATPERTPIQKG